MNQDRAPKLETERLLLRPHQVSDFPAYLDMWTDPDVLRFTIREPRSEQDAWMTLKRVMGNWPLLDYGLWALERKDTGEFIGDAGFMDARRPYTEDKRGVPEIAYALAPAHSRQGFMTEALAAIHHWLDEHMPGQQTFALIYDENTASIRVAEKLGYIEERRVDNDDLKSALYTRNPLSSRPPTD